MLTISPPFSDGIPTSQMPEEWKDINAKYQVSNLGRVKSFWGKEEKILKPWRDELGYDYIVIVFDGKKRTRLVHRLVAEAFIPNPDGKRVVNHKKGTAAGHGVSNLEWTTHSENTTHAYRVLGRKSAQLGKKGEDSQSAKTYAVIYPDGKKEIIKCMSEFCKTHGLNHPHMSTVAHGKRNHHRGFKVEII